MKKKPGKAKKAQVRKPKAARRAAPQAAQVAEKVEQKIVAGKTVAIVSRGAERIPVQLKDEAHLAELREKHGADCVEVQP